MRRPGPNAGKTNALGEEMGKGTLGAAGVGVQTRREISAEIMSGRSYSQQGLGATCEDLLTKALTVGGRREWDWRMSL